jgi:hypothetical protein
MSWIFGESFKRRRPRRKPRQQDPEDAAAAAIRASIPDSKESRREEYDFYNSGGEQIISDAKEESREIRRSRT